MPPECSTLSGGVTTVETPSRITRTPAWSTACAVEFVLLRTCTASTTNCRASTMTSTSGFL